MDSRRDACFFGETCEGVGQYKTSKRRGRNVRDDGDLAGLGRRPAPSNPPSLSSAPEAAISERTRDHSEAQQSSSFIK